ncbi:MAG: response regulator transcription factor [Actinomycetaceae bacterium]|nr:response regulator transcription factor [Actinomycetaceae bacterium]
MIRVVVVDDHPLVRSAVELMLEAEPDLQVVASADDGVSAMPLIRQTRPDVVLMDIRMPRLDGIEATAAVTADPDLSATRVLVFTTFEEDTYVLSALRAGASGFVGKSADQQEITRAIRAVHTGEALLTPGATRALIERFLEVDPRHVASQALLGQLELLTDRERQVVTCIGRGYSNAELAEQLVISPATVKSHISRILSKLNLRDRAQLVIFAYETGLVRVGEIA